MGRWKPVFLNFRRNRYIIRALISWVEVGMAVINAFTNSSPDCLTIIGTKSTSCHRLNCSLGRSWVPFLITDCSVLQCIV